MDSHKALVTILVPDHPTTDNTETTGTAGTTPHSYALPEPTTYSGTTTTLIDGGTSVSGHLLGSTIRDDVAQISLSWNYLEAEVWAEINQLFMSRYINTVLFYDQTKGDWDRREMYISDRSAGLWRRDVNGDVLGWTGCSLKLTEV